MSQPQLMPQPSGIFANDNGPALPRIKDISAIHNAGVSVLPLEVINRLVPLKAEAMDTAGLALRLGEGGAAMGGQLLSKGYAGPLGAAMGAGVSIVSGSYEKGNRLLALQEALGGYAAKKLGKDPVSLTEEDWEQLGEENPYIKQYLEATQAEAKSRLPENLAAAGGGFAAMTASGSTGAAIGTAVGGPLGTVVGGAFGLAAGVAGSSVATSVVRAFKDAPPEETGVGAIMALSKKLQQPGAKATQDEVFRIFALGDKELNETIAEESGKPFPTKAFEAMTDAERKDVQKTIEAHPKLINLMDHCAKLAAAINNKTLTPESLVQVNPLGLIGPESLEVEGVQTAQTVGTAALKGGYVEREQERRAANSDVALGQVV